MTIFIVITYDIEFSNHVINYFKFQNPPISAKTAFISIGLNNRNEKEILKLVKDKINEYKSVDAIAIFSDAGLPTKLGKRIILDNPNVKSYHSHGSLIENGFLVYMMLNTRAPEKSVMSVLKEETNKEYKKE